jgi:ferritin
MKKAIICISDQDLIQSLAAEELYANRHYLYAAACSQTKQLQGFQKFYEAEAVSELEHWQGWRDISNDYGFEIEVPSTKEVVFKDESVVGVLTASYDLELGLMKKYDKAYDKAESNSLKVDIQKYLKIQRKAVGEYADLLAEVESVGVGFVNLRLLQA